MPLGHLFVLRGDIRRLKCDAWALPTDRELSVTEGWRIDAPQATLDLIDAIGHDSPSWGRSTVIGPADWESPDKTAWLVDAGSHPGEDPSWFVKRAAAFIKAAAEGTPATGGTRLFALPFIGSGAGGGARTKGELLRELVPCLEKAAHHHDVDIALVLSHPAAFAAAQALRNDPESWALPSEMRARAEELADRDNLVLFLGAGISQGAGLPGWEALLGMLADDACFDAAAKQEFNDLGLLDRASVLAQRFEGTGETLFQRIARIMQAPHYSLAHGLLASLPTREVVTTNYDTLFEDASRAAGQPASVIPYASVESGKRWLLKLHGTADRSDGKDIVLARRDYLGYDANRGALAGMVQALLLTRHMLFVGFSLTDENFHRMVHAVRVLLEAHAPDGTAASDVAPAPQLGTTLSLPGPKLTQGLWRDIDVVDISGDADDPSGARTLAIFLDCMLRHASRNPAHLLDATFAGLKGDDAGYQRLIEALRELQQAASGSGPGPITDLLEALGAEPIDRSPTS
jgi:hypothetical protein